MLIYVKKAVDTTNNYGCPFCQETFDIEENALAHINMH